MNEAQIALDHYTHLVITDEMKKYIKEEGGKDVDELLKRINTRLVKDLRESSQKTFDRIIKLMEQMVKDTLEGK